MTSALSTPAACPNYGRLSTNTCVPPSGRGFRNNGGVTDEELRRVLARNVRERMEKNPALGSYPKLGAASGLGKSTIGHVLACDGAATLDTIAALARAFRCQPWELLADDDSTRREALKRMLG